MSSKWLYVRVARTPRLTPTLLLLLLRLLLLLPRYHQVDFPVDISVIHLSAGKSIFEDGFCRVPLVPGGGGKDAGAGEDAGADAMSEGGLDRCRLLLVAARAMRRFEIGAEMAKQMENDFVQTRQRDASTTTDAFHRWVTLAQLVAATHGDGTLRPAYWQRVLDMEAERAARCAEFAAARAAAGSPAGESVGGGGAAGVPPSPQSVLDVSPNKHYVEQ